MAASLLPVLPPPHSSAAERPDVPPRSVRAGQRDTERLSFVPEEAVDDLPARLVAHVTELLGHLGIRGSVVCRDRRTEHPAHLWLDITAEESGLLIGERGMHLRALEHVLRLLSRNVLPPGCRCYVDVNGYQLRRMEFLKHLARECARKVVASHHAVTLDPMPAMERRIVHLALTGDALIETGSVGEEPRRRVIIRPRDPFLTPETAPRPGVRREHPGV